MPRTPSPAPPQARAKAVSRFINLLILPFPGKPVSQLFRVSMPDSMLTILGRLAERAGRVSLIGTSRGLLDPRTMSRSVRLFNVLLPMIIL